MDIRPITVKYELTTYYEKRVPVISNQADLGSSHRKEIIKRVGVWFLQVQSIYPLTVAKKK